MKFFPNDEHNKSYMLGVLIVIPIWTLSLIWKVWPGVPILSFVLYYILMRISDSKEFKDGVD